MHPVLAEFEREKIIRIDALSELLHLLRDLMLRCPAPRQWHQIRALQRRLFLKHIRYSAALIQRQFGPAGDSFEPQLWFECLLSCVCLAKWALEDANSGKCQSSSSGVQSAGDVAEPSADEEMGQFAVRIVRSLWHSLTPRTKLQMMPEAVGPVLELALCEDEQLRQLAMPLFFDMLSTELWLTTSSSSAPPATTMAASPTKSADTLGGVVLRKMAQQIQQQQQQNVPKPSSSSTTFEDQFIGRLDSALDTAAADEQALAGFRRAFNHAFQQQMIVPAGADRQAEAMHAFVQKVNNFLELFAAYLLVLRQDDQLEMGLFCTVQLVDFYQSTGQNGLYLLYLYKLYNLHMSAGNWVEAALTLQKHANLLGWSQERPASWLYGAKQQFSTQLELKEHLYLEMAQLLAKGGHWELAIERNKELATVYETILLDYAKLAALLRRNAELFERVTRELRFESNYFLVAFYGRACPAHLVNRKFVFRGEQLELWGGFKQRLLASFGDYKFVDSMDLDSVDQQLMDQPDSKFMQIIAVAPLCSPAFASLLQSPSRLASWYHRHHGVQRFELVRREFRPDTKWTRLLGAEESEVMRLWLHKKVVSIQRPLPDLLNFCPVTDEQDLEPLSPMEVAIEKVREANDKLADLSGKVGEGFAQQFLMNLGGMVRGIVQADVGGGVKNYQPFFSAHCRAQCTEEENRSIEHLRLLILEQVTLLEFALFVHAGADQARANAGFHNSLVASFLQHRDRVEAQLGTAKSILPPGASIYVLEQQQQQSMTAAKSSMSGGSSGGLSGGESLHNIHSTSTAPFASSSRRADQSHSIGDSQQQQQSSTTAVAATSHLSVGRPPSAGSASHSSGSTASNSAAAVIFRSPLGAASSLIRTTIQGKAKQKQLKQSAGSGRKTGAIRQFPRINSNTSANNLLLHQRQQQQQQQSTAVIGCHVHDPPMFGCVHRELLPNGGSGVGAAVAAPPVEAALGGNVGAKKVPAAGDQLKCQRTMSRSASEQWW